MRWYRSDLTDGSSCRALHHGHPGKMAQLVITASIWVGRLNLSTAEARAGRCHRTWAAPFLVRAGWRVILDGVEVQP